MSFAPIVNNLGTSDAKDLCNLACPDDVTHSYVSVPLHGAQRYNGVLGEVRMIVLGQFE